MHKKKFLLFFPDMEDLARRIAKTSQDIVLGSIDWNHFETGYLNGFIHDVEGLRGLDVSFLASFEAPETIFEQLAVIYALPRYGVGRFRIILPYFPGTMDRVEKRGQIVTAKTIARLLEATPPCCPGGPAELVFYDIHALQEEFFFERNVVPRPLSAIPLLRDKLEDVSDLAISFPDSGAEKRFGKMFGKFPLVVCHKVRDDDKRIITIKEGDPRGKNVVIVDDLVNTGGTLVSCKNALLQAGAQTVSAYVTHGLLPDESWKKFVDSGFEHFWITDSCPRTTQKVRDVKPFEVVSLAESLAEVVRGS